MLMGKSNFEEIKEKVIEHKEEKNTAKKSDISKPKTDKMEEGFFGDAYEKALNNDKSNTKKIKTPKTKKAEKEDFFGDTYDKALNEEEPQK